MGVIILFTLVAAVVFWFVCRRKPTKGSVLTPNQASPSRSAKIFILLPFFMMILSRYFYSTLSAKILINPKLTFDKQIHAGKFNTTVIPLLKKPKVAFQKFQLNNDFFHRKILKHQMSYICKYRVGII